MYRNFPILVAEDEDSDIYFLKRGFLKAGVNAPLDFVRNGETAVAYLAGRAPYGNRQTHPFPKLMLLDLKMPGMTGFDVLKWLRAERGLRQLPVIVLSSSSYQPDVDRAHELGANAYVTKPLGLDQMEELVQCLEAWWLRRHCYPSCSEPS